MHKILSHKQTTSNTNKNNRDSIIALATFTDALFQSESLMASLHLCESISSDEIERLIETLNPTALPIQDNEILSKEAALLLKQLQTNKHDVSMAINIKNHSIKGSLSLGKGGFACLLLRALIQKNNKLEKSKNIHSLFTTAFKTMNNDVHTDIETKAFIVTGIVDTLDLRHYETLHKHPYFLEITTKILAHKGDFNTIITYLSRKNDQQALFADILSELGIVYYRQRSKNNSNYKSDRQSLKQLASSKIRSMLSEPDKLFMYARYMKNLALAVSKASKTKLDNKEKKSFYDKISNFFTDLKTITKEDPIDISFLESQLLNCYAHIGDQKQMETLSTSFKRFISSKDEIPKEIFSENVELFYLVIKNSKKINEKMTRDLIEKFSKKNEPTFLSSLNKENEKQREAHYFSLKCMAWARLNNAGKICEIQEKLTHNPYFDKTQVMIQYLKTLRQDFLNNKENIFSSDQNSLRQLIKQNISHAPNNLYLKTESMLVLSSFKLPLTEIESLLDLQCTQKFLRTVDIFFIENYIKTIRDDFTTALSAKQHRFNAIDMHIKTSSPEQFEKADFLKIYFSLLVYFGDTTETQEAIQRSPLEPSEKIKFTLLCIRKDSSLSFKEKSDRLFTFLQDNQLLSLSEDNLDIYMNLLNSGARVNLCDAISKEFFEKFIFSLEVDNKSTLAISYNELIKDKGTLNLLEKLPWLLYATTLVKAEKKTEEKQVALFKIFLLQAAQFYYSDFYSGKPIHESDYDAILLRTFSNYPDFLYSLEYSDNDRSCFYLENYYHYHKFELLWTGICNAQSQPMGVCAVINSFLKAYQDYNFDKKAWEHLATTLYYILFVLPVATSDSFYPTTTTFSFKQISYIIRSLVESRFLQSYKPIQDLYTLINTAFSGDMTALSIFNQSSAKTWPAPLARHLSLFTSALSECPHISIRHLHNLTLYVEGNRSMYTKLAWLKNSAPTQDKSELIKDTFSSRLVYLFGELYTVEAVEQKQPELHLPYTELYHIKLKNNQEKERLIFLGLTRKKNFIAYQLMSNENKLDDFDIQLSPENPDRFFIENHTAILKKFYQDPQADENQLIPFRLLLTQTNALSALYIEELFKQLAKFRNLEGMIHTLSIAIQKGVHDFEHCLPSCYEKLFVLLFDFSQGSDESLAEALSIAHHLLHLESEKRHSQILQNDINKILSRIQPASFITEKCFSYFTRIRLACVSDKLAALTVLFSIDLKTPNSLKSKLFPAMVFSDLLYKTLFSDLARHALDIPRTTETRSERRQYYTHLVYLASTGFSFNAIHENRLFDILLAYFSRTPETLLGSTELEKGTLSSVESLRLIQRHFSILKQTFQESLRHVSRFPRDLDMYRNCLFETLQLLYLIQVQHTEKSIKTVTNIDKTFFGDDFVQSTLSELESLIPEKIKKRFDFEFAVFHLHYSFFKNQFGELYKRLVGPYSSLRNNVFFAKEFVSVIDNLKDASSFALETQKKGYEEMKKCLPKSLFTQKKHYDELTPSLLQVFIIYHLFLPVFKTVSEIPESDTPLSFVLSSVMTKLLESNNSRYFEYCMSQDTLSSENILFLHKDLAYCVFSFYKAMTKPSEYGDTFTEHILKLNLDERTCFTDYISQFILPLFCANRLKKRAERVLTHLKGDISKDSLKNEFESESQSIIQQEPVSQRSSEKGNKVSIKNKKKNKKKNHIQDKNTPLKTLKENLNSALQKLNNTIKPSWAFDLEPTTVSKQHTFFEGTITLIDELSQKIKKETNLETCYGYYQEILKNLYSLSGSTREAEIVNLLEQPNTLATFLKDKPQFKSNLTWLKQKKESKMQEIQNKLSSSILEIFRVILKEAFDSRSSSNNSSEQSCNLIINAIKEKTSTPNSKLTSFFNALKELDETIDSDSLEQMIQTLCQLFEEVSKNTFTQDGIEKGLESIFLASAYTEADSKEASKTFRKIAYKSFEETLIQYQNCHNMITEQLLTIERSVDKEIDLIIKKANAVQAQIDKQHLDLAKRYWLNRFSESLSQSITHFISTGEKNETPIFWKHDSLSNDLNIFLKNETNLKAFLKDDDCTKVIDEALSKIKELDSDNLNKVFYELFFSKIKVYESNALTLLAERITNRFIQYSLKLTIVANSPLLDMLTLIVKDKDSCQIGPRFESAYFSAFCYAILKSKYKTYGHIFEAIQDSVDTTLQDHPSLSTEQLKSLSHIISYLSQFVLIEEGLDKAFTLFSERIYPRSNHIYSTSPDTLFFYHHTEIAIQETSMFKLNEFICEKIMYRENIFQAIDEAISFDPKLLKFSQFEQLDEEELRKRGQFLTTLITPNFPIEKTQPLFFYLLAQKWNSESQTLFGRYLLKEYLRILDIQKDTDMSVMGDIYLQILSYLFDLCYDIISKDMAVFLKRFLYKKESSWDNLSNLIDKSMTILHTSIRLLYDRIKTIQKNDTKKLDYYLWIQKSWMKKMRYITEFLFLSLLKPSIKNYTRSIVLQEKILKDIETLEATNNQHLSHSQHISAVASESIINNNLYTSMAPITDLYYFVLTRLITVLQNTPSIYAKKNYSKDRFLSPLTEAATAIKTYSFDKSPITKIVNTTENPHAVARTLNFIEHLFEISSDIADNPELSQGIQLIDFELDSAGASLKNLLSNFTSLSLYDFLNLPLNKISPDFGLLCDDSEQRFLTLLHNTFKKSVSTGNKKENETIQKILLKRYPKPASCQMDAILVYCLIHCIRNIHPTSDWTLSDFKKQLRDVTNEAYDKEDAFFGVDEKKIIDFLTDFALLVSSEGKSKINLELLGTCDNVQLQNTLRSINENDLPTIDCARLVTFIFDEYYSSLISQPQKSTGLGFKESLFFDNLNSILAYYFENLFIKTPITMAELCLILSKNQSLATTVSKWKTVSSISLQETLHSSYIRIHQLALDRDYRLVNTKKENYTSTELKIQDRIAFLSRFYFHSIGDLTHSNQTGLFLTLRASLEEVKWPENHTILLETFFSPSYFDLNQFWMTRPIENNHFPIASRTIVNILVRLIHLISNSNETDSELSESFFSHFIGQALIDTDTSKTLDLNAIKRIFKNNKNKKFDDIDKTLLTAFQSSLNRFLLRLVEDGSFPSSTCPELDNETIIALKYTIFNLCIHTFPTLSQLDLPTFFKQLTNRKTNSLALWVKNDSKLAHSVQFQIRMITYRLNLDFLKQYQASILNNQNLVEKKHLSDYLRAYAELFSFTLDTFFIELLLKKDALELDKPLLFDEKICFNHKEYLSLLMMIAKQFVGFCLDWSKETSFKYDSEYGLNIATFIESIQSNIAFLTQSLNGISESSAKEHVSKMIDTCKKEADKEQFKIHQLDTVAQEPRINLDLFESVKGKYMFPPLFYLAEQLCHLEKWLEWKKQGN